MSHFNEISREWDKPEKIKQAEQYAARIKSHLNFFPQKILEVGCGTGLLGEQFVTENSSLLGVDTSTGMLEVFNEKFKHNHQVSSRLLDLEENVLHEKFDLIISSMAFHHLKDPAGMVSKLRKNLKDGGVLAIIDLDQEDGTFHPDPKNMGVHHFGFSEEETKSWGSGFHKMHREIVNKIEKNGGEYPIFLALYYR